MCFVALPRPFAVLLHQFELTFLRITGVTAQMSGVYVVTLFVNGELIGTTPPTDGGLTPAWSVPPTFIIECPALGLCELLALLSFFPGEDQYRDVGVICMNAIRISGDTCASRFSAIRLLTTR